jgi:hypothetical protein
MAPSGTKTCSTSRWMPRCSTPDNASSTFRECRSSEPYRFLFDEAMFVRLHQSSQ